MSRKGCGKTAPLWMILMVPPCSTTNNRLLPSFGCSSPRGEFRPETNDPRPTVVLGGGMEGEMIEVEFFPPQPVPRSNATATTVKLIHATNSFFILEPYSKCDSIVVPDRFF